MSTAAAIIDKYAYDAYGNMLGLPGHIATADAALTTFLYSGEKTDATGLQYLRARYYDPNSGRFNRLDPFVGNMKDPQSQHKYLYTHADPVNLIDPIGEFIGLSGFLAGSLITMKVRSLRSTAHIGILMRITGYGFWGLAGGVGGYIGTNILTQMLNPEREWLANGSTPEHDDNRPIADWKNSIFLVLKRKVDSHPGLTQSQKASAMSEAEGIADAYVAEVQSRAINHFQPELQ